jgi:hypothetical protein
MNALKVNELDFARKPDQKKLQKQAKQWALEVNAWEEEIQNMDDLIRRRFRPELPEEDVARMRDLLNKVHFNLPQEIEGLRELINLYDYHVTGIGATVSPSRKQTILNLVRDITLRFRALSYEVGSIKKEFEW